MAKPPRAGPKNRRIAFQKKGQSPNGKGGWVESWGAPIVIAAEMIPLRGNEAVEESVVRGVQLWKVTVWFRPDLNTDCRLMKDGKELNIQSCEDPDGRRRELVMTASSGERS
jgi:SPP1 family predicted phage head-tail adaptor